MHEIEVSYEKDRNSLKYGRHSDTGLREHREGSDTGTHAEAPFAIWNVFGDKVRETTPESQKYSQEDKRFAR